MSTPKNGSSERSMTRELPPGPQLASELASLGMRRRPGMGEVGPARRSPRDKAFIDDLTEFKRLGPLFPAESQADGDDIESYAAAAIAMDAYLTVIERLHGGTMPGDSPIELARAGDAISARLALEPGSIYLKFLNGKTAFEATGKDESSALASLGTELARAHAAHVAEALTPDGELSCAYDCLLAEIWDQAMHTGTPQRFRRCPVCGKRFVVGSSRGRTYCSEACSKLRAYVTSTSLRRDTAGDSALESLAPLVADVSRTLLAEDTDALRDLFGIKV